VHCGVLFKGTSVFDFTSELITQLTWENILEETNTTTRVRVAKQVSSRGCDGNGFCKIDDISVRRSGVVSRSSRPRVVFSNSYVLHEERMVGST